MGGVLGAESLFIIHQFVNSQLWECDDVILSSSSHTKLAGSSQSCREACRKLKLHSGVNS